jgi:hypothetical protein
MDLLWLSMLVFLWPVGIFYGPLVYFVAIWYILWLFDINSPLLERCTRKIWQPRFIHVASRYIQCITELLRTEIFSKLSNVLLIMYAMMTIIGSHFLQRTGLRSTALCSEEGFVIVD